jgi:Undecaprenyl-phosphate galactose phosphotransferase WbaP
LLADFCSLSLVFAAAVWWRHFLSPAYSLTSFFELFPFLIMMLGAFWIHGLYPGVLMHPAEEMRRISMSVTTVFLVMACSAFLWRIGLVYSRSVFLTTWACGAPMVLLVRCGVRRYFSRQEWWGVPALILGSGQAAQRVARTLRDGRWGVKVVGMLSDDPISAWGSDLPSAMGPLTAAPRFAKAGLSQYAIIALPSQSRQEIRRLIQDCCHGFRHVLFVPDMPGICSLGIVTRELGGEVGFEIPQRLFQSGSEIAKRLLDFTLSLTAIIILSPLFLFLTIAVGISSKGPAFYRQARYGRDGKVFWALKFRSMVPNADRILADYLASHPECLFEWQRDQKLRNDPRVTRIGKWLRRLSLDELPQLLNVLAGQMSLVGPRPIVKAEIEKYGRIYGIYSRVRPGITGLWQVSGRNNTTYEERIELDEYYVHNWSVWFDAYLLLRTVKTVLSREGAY